MIKKMSYRLLILSCAFCLVSCGNDPVTGSMRLALGEFAQTVCEPNSSLALGGYGACTLRIQVYNGPYVNSAPGTLFDSGCVPYGGDQLTLSNFPTGDDLTIHFEVYDDAGCEDAVATGARGGVVVAESGALGTWFIPTFEVGGFRSFPEFSSSLIDEVRSTSCSDDDECIEISPVARCDEGTCAMPATAYPLNIGTARAFHATTTLADGRIVITGGLGRSLGDGQWIATDEPVEVFDPVRLTFDRPEITGVTDLRMAFHNAISLDDGRVGAIGGARQATLQLVDSPIFGEGRRVLSFQYPEKDSTQSDNLLQLAVAFDLSSNEAVAGALTQPRVGAQSTKLADGRVLVTGGAVRAGDGVVVSKFADTCAFDGTPECAAEGSLVNSRAGHCSVCRDAECNEVLLLGGLAAEEDNISDNFFEAYSDGEFVSIPLEDSDLESNVLYSNCVKAGPDIFLPGGQSGRNRPADIVPVGIGAFQDGYAGIKVGSAVTLYRSHAAATVLDGNAVLVTGGINNQGLAVNDCYVIRDGSVEPLTTGLQQSRFGHTATVLTTGPLAGAVLIVGGFTSDANGDLQLATTAELYIP